MLTDRYDELLIAFYEGTLPGWLPQENQALFARESLRRRCDLGQNLRRCWPCTMFLARNILSANFAQAIYSRFPETRYEAQNLTTALYLALERTLDDCHAPETLVELFEYESLVLSDLLVTSNSASRAVEDSRATQGGSGEVLHFRHDVLALHARMTLYAGAEAPASFAVEYRTPRRTTYVRRSRSGGEWLIEDVTELMSEPRSFTGSDPE